MIFPSPLLLRLIRLYVLLRGNGRFHSFIFLAAYPFRGRVLCRDLSRLSSGERRGSPGQVASLSRDGRFLMRKQAQNMSKRPKLSGAQGRKKRKEEEEQRDKDRGNVTVR